jgi:hypothetical protein
MCVDNEWGVFFCELYAGSNRKHPNRPKLSPSKQLKGAGHYIATATEEVCEMQMLII